MRKLPIASTAAKIINSTTKVNAADAIYQARHKYKEFWT